MPYLDGTEILGLALAKGNFFAALLTQNRFFSLKCHFLSFYLSIFLSLGALGFFCLSKVVTLLFLLLACI